MHAKVLVRVTPTSIATHATTLPRAHHIPHVGLTGALRRHGGIHRVARALVATFPTRVGLHQPHATLARGVTSAVRVPPPAAQATLLRREERALQVGRNVARGLRTAVARAELLVGDIHA